MKQDSSPDDLHWPEPETQDHQTRMSSEIQAGSGIRADLLVPGALTMGSMITLVFGIIAFVNGSWLLGTALILIGAIAGGLMFLITKRWGHHA